MSKLILGINDLRTTNPDLLGEWDYQKNAILNPTEVTAGSRKRVWWQCAKGHSWQREVYARVLKNSVCPICSNQVVIQGINDFATVHPEMLCTWNYQKNKVQPSEISGGSGKGIWWKCENGHEWFTAVSNRVRQKQCPYCSGRKIWPGYNDLATKYPELLKEWDYTRAC